MKGSRARVETHSVVIGHVDVRVEGVWRNRRREGDELHLLHGLGTRVGRSDTVLPYTDYATYIADRRVFMLAIEFTLASHCSRDRVR